MVILPMFHAKSKAVYKGIELKEPFLTDLLTVIYNVASHKQL